MTPSEPRRHRLADLLGHAVIASDGRRLGLVTDLRLAPTAALDGVLARLVVDGIVVDGGHPGSMLGYDRRAEQGPRLVRWVVRLLHRHAGYVPWASVRDIDWGERTVRVDVTALDPLEGRPA